MTGQRKVSSRLGGVPETLLWNLYQRAAEARRPDAVLRDATELARLRALPHVTGLAELRPPPGRGPLYGGLFPLLNRVPPIRRMGLTGCRSHS